MGCVFVYTDSAVLRTFSTRYGPVAWRVATAPMKGVSCAYAPASSRHSTSRPMIRPSSSTALRMRTTEFSRGLAVASSSARELTIFTGRPDFRASRQAKCSNVTSSFPPNPPPTVEAVTRTCDSGRSSTEQRVARTPNGFCVLVVTWKPPCSSTTARQARGSM